jgi:hypothetical protein
MQSLLHTEQTKEGKQSTYRKYKLRGKHVTILQKKTYYEHTELYRSIEFACCSNNTWQNAMNKGTLALQLFQTKCSSMNSNTTRTYGSRVKQCSYHCPKFRSEMTKC